jgi:ribosomal protein L7/L12
MTTLLAALDYQALAIGGAIGAALSLLGGSAISSATEEQVRRLANEVHELKRQLDALLQHEGIVLPPRPSGLSAEVERLAINPHSKIAAIKLYRDENPGTSLRAAKEKIEDYCHKRA